MAHYDNVEIIANKFGAYVEQVLREKGLVVNDVIKLHNEIHSSVSDVYSRAILKTGLPHEEAPTFSNVPRQMFSWIVRDNLVSIFETLNIPTTQKCAHLLARNLQKNEVQNALSHIQLEALLEMEIFQKEFVKISNWLVKARANVVAMSANFPLLQAVTEEEKEFANSLDFDWYYDYSDDRNVWRTGNTKHKEVQVKVMETYIAKPHLRKVVEVVAKANGFATKFFTG